MTPPIQNADFPAAAHRGRPRHHQARPSRATTTTPATPTADQRGDGRARDQRHRRATRTSGTQSAIIITYDESDGFYDHVPPRILSYGPDGLPLARGVRIPLILISPYARAHVVSHAEGDHNAVIETINAIFDLPPLASLPDEKAALISGEDAKFNGPNGFVQHHLGPRDINTPETDDLLPGSTRSVWPARSRRCRRAMRSLTSPRSIRCRTMPASGCTAIGMTPVDRAQGVEVAPPANFNTLPATLPAYN